MSRRTEMPTRLTERAKHSKVQCPVPEVKDPVAQGEFTSLLREICAPDTAETPGAAVSNGRLVSTEVSRGHSTESNEPATKTPDGLTTREGPKLAGSTSISWTQGWR